jgi:hypothetical protein
VFNLPRFIDLGLCNKVGGGQTNNVYELPEMPGVLIKTVRSDIVDPEGFNKRSKGARRLRRLGIYNGVARELNEFLVQLRRRRVPPFNMPFAQPLGFVQTTEGLGYMVERIDDRDGRMAPTMRDLCRAGSFGALHLKALNEFFDRCKREHLVLGDANSRNIVFTDARIGKPEFVCIDGLGEKSVIPIHALSRYFNDRKIERLRQRLLREAEWARTNPAGQRPRRNGRKIFFALTCAGVLTASTAQPTEKATGIEVSQAPVQDEGFIDMAQDAIDYAVSLIAEPAEPLPVLGPPRLHDVSRPRPLPANLTAV